MRNLLVSAALVLALAACGGEPAAVERVPFADGYAVFWDDPDVSVCPVHGDELARARVRMMSGLLYSAPAGYDEARATGFPLSCGAVWTGCMGTDGRTVVRRCPTCHEAEVRWMAARRDG